MPTADKVSLNPNDRSASGKGMYAKKQYSEVNQHYIHANAVLPQISATPDVNSRADLASPIKDPYAGLPDKPNNMSLFTAGTLHKAI